MPDIQALVPHELIQRIDRSADAFNLNRSQFIERALEHFMDHVDHMEVLSQLTEKPEQEQVDWSEARLSMRSANCSYDSCPFDGRCPPELCPL